MKRLLTTCLLLCVLPGLALAARPPKESLATPTFDDQPNYAEPFSVNIGTCNAIKLYTPRQRSAPIEDRKVFVQNMSATRRLHITTWAVPTDQILTATAAVYASLVLNISTLPMSGIDLSAGVTYYGRYERGVAGAIADTGTGASSDSVRGIVHSMNQTIKITP